jgi:hypothetical protein
MGNNNVANRSISLAGSAVNEVKRFAVGRGNSGFSFNLFQSYLWDTDFIFGQHLCQLASGAKVSGGNQNVVRQLS